MSIKKKRRLKRIPQLILCVLLFSLIVGIAYLAIDVTSETVLKNDPNQVSILKNLSNFLEFSLNLTPRPDDRKTVEADLNLYSDKYLLLEVDSRKVLYGKNINEQMYPASLTKLVALDIILSSDLPLDSYASFSFVQRSELIAQNASLAYLKAETDYTIRDLLYGLILPSGADAEAALSNVFDFDQGYAKLADRLRLVDSNFVNYNGLHDDNHYSTLMDIATVALDIIKNNPEFIRTMEYVCEDGTVLRSTLSNLSQATYANVYGGKTGYTGQAGENLLVYFNLDGKDYLLLLANAPGNPYAGQYYHFADFYTFEEFLRIKE